MRELPAIISLYLKNCSFKECEKILSEFNIDDFDSFILIKESLIRIYSELLDFEKLDKVGKELFKYINTYPDRVYYNLAIIERQKRDINKCKEYLELALSYSLVGNIYYYKILYLLGFCYFVEKDDEKSENVLFKIELEKVKKLDIDFYISVMIGRLHLDCQDDKDILEIEKLVIENKNWYMYHYVLNLYIKYNLKLGNITKAQEYYNRLEGFVLFSDLNEVKKLLSDCKKRIEEIQPDITILYQDKEILINDKIIKFKNKNILFQLLLFLIDEKRGLTKEDISIKVWGEDYNPSIHDNRIYFSVNRLRKMVGFDLIQIRGNKYFLKKLNVLVRD